MNEQKDLSFEKAFDRLEEILQSIHENKISLQDSIQMFEEADQLIQFCNTNLTQAEKKIETLVKNRNQELIKDEKGNPITEEFTTVLKNNLS